MVFTGKLADLMYNILGLTRVQVSDGNLDAFQTTWIKVLQGMKTVPDEPTLEEIYYSKVRNVRDLAEDNHHYDLSLIHI